MPELKHTPAPWEFKNGIIQEVSQNSEIVQVKRTLASINTFGIKPEEAEANAKVIAAAPELLEALTKLVLLKEGKSEHGREFLHQAISPIVWLTAKAAIKKATE